MVKKICLCVIKAQSRRKKKYLKLITASIISCKKIKPVKTDNKKQANKMTSYKCCDVLGFHDIFSSNKVEESG